MDFKIEEVVENIRVVDEQRDYWMIRSYGGELYDDFYDKNYVGLGFNEIPFEYINEASKADEATFTRLRNSISSKYDLPKSEVTRWANQLIDFQKGVKIGDIVVTPSENSDQYAFGVVSSDTYVVKDNRTFKFHESFEPYPEKRKKIHWVKKIDKDELNGDLKSLSSTRMPLTNAYKYRETIEGYLSTVYIKENRLYLTIQIDQEEDINAYAFNDFLSGITFFYKEFCDENGIVADEELYLKIKVQSKGKVALKAMKIVGGVGIVGLVLLSNSPEVKLQIGKSINFDAKSDGFFTSYTKFLDASQERKIRYEKFQDSMAKLKAKPVQESVTAEEDHPSDGGEKKHKKSSEHDMPKKKLSDTTHKENQIELGEERQQSDRPNKRND